MALTVSRRIRIGVRRRHAERAIGELRGMAVAIVLVLVPDQFVVAAQPLRRKQEESVAEVSRIPSRTSR